MNFFARLFLYARVTVALLLPFLALGAIAVGAWMIYPPAAFIVTGALVLLDLYLEDKPPPPSAPKA